MEEKNKEQKEKKAAPKGGEPRPAESGREEACPLCEVSEETVERLKKAKRKETFEEKEK